MADLAFLDQEQVLWILIFGALLTFVFSFSVGANCVANVVGTAVGAKVLSQFQAAVLATISVILGAVVVGPVVADTVENDIVNINVYRSNPKLLMMGMISVLLACTLWVIIATALKLPIAVTHSVVGAIFGFNLIARGMNGFGWDSIILIAVSWVTSPVLSGCLALIAYYIMLYSFIKKEHPFESGVKTLPVWYGGVVFINVFTVLIQLQSYFEGYDLSLYICIPVSAGCAIFVALLVWFIFVPMLRKESETETEGLLKQEGKADATDYRHERFLNNINVANSEDIPRIEENLINAALIANAERAEQESSDDVQENPEVARLCSPLLVLSVFFTGFAFGSILVSVSVAPLSTIWNIYQSTKVTRSISNPFWLFVYGSVALTLGFGVIGGRVTETIGEGITSMSSSSAFCIDFGSTVVILIASNIGIPLSTTHCKIGAIAMVGFFSNGNGGVNYKLLRNIILAWMITLPVSAGLSAGLLALMRHFDPNHLNSP